MRALLALVVTSLVTMPVWATQTEPTQFGCPVDQTPVDGFVVLSANNLGGADRDLCPHERDDVSPLIIQMSTCKTCGYSAPSASFERPISEKTRQKITKTWGKTKSLEPHEQWARHATILGWEGAGAQEVAEAWVAAGWSVRLQYNALSADKKLAFDQTVAMGRAVKAVQALKEENKPATGYESEIAIGRALLGIAETDPEHADVARFTAAAVFRVRGESEQALRVVDQIEKPTAALADGIGALRESIALERSYFDKAMPSLRGLAADTKMNDELHGRANYVAAEIARRTGRSKEAKAFYEVAKSSSLFKDPQFKIWIDAGLGAQ